MLLLAEPSHSHGPSVRECDISAKARRKRRSHVGRVPGRWAVTGSPVCGAGRPGMIVNMGEIERTQQAMYNLGIFSKVEYHFEQSSYLVGRGRQSASHCLGDSCGCGESWWS